MKKKSKEPIQYTVRQASLALFGDESPAGIKRVQRLIEGGELSAVKLPGETGPYLVSEDTLHEYQEKRRQAAEKTA